MLAILTIYIGDQALSTIILRWQTLEFYWNSPFLTSNYYDNIMILCSFKTQTVIDFTPWAFQLITQYLDSNPDPIQVILAGTLTGVQGDIRCKILAALSTAK